MSFLQTYSKEIFSLFVPLFTALIGYALRSRARIVWSITNARTMLIEEAMQDGDGLAQNRKITVNTASVFIRNNGREAATELECVFNWKPQHLNVWPVRSFEAKAIAEDRFIITFPNLAPKEFLGIELLSVRTELPALIQIRSLQGVGRRIQTEPQQTHPKWKLLLVLYFMIAGAVSTLYLVLTLVQILANTPVKPLP